MKQLYFIRLGKSEMNKRGVWSGHTDTPLAPEGHQQAQLAGQKAKAEGLSFDIIVSSPLQRAHNTAQHVATHTGYPHENIVLDDRLKERNFGSLEGNRATSVIGAKYYLDESAIDGHPEVETLQELQTRAEETLAYLQSLDEDTVLVVAHGAYGRALYRAVNKLPLHRRDIRYENAVITQFI